MHYSLKELYLCEKYCSSIINKNKYKTYDISLKRIFKSEMVSIYITVWKYNKTEVNKISHSWTIMFLLYLRWSK